MKGPLFMGVTGELTAKVVCDAAAPTLQAGLGAVLILMKIRGAFALVFKTHFCPDLLPNAKAYLA